MNETNIVDPPQTFPDVTHPEDMGSDEQFADDAGVGPSAGAAAQASSPSFGDASEEEAQETIEMLGKLPAEFGMLLILSGIAGVLLPGPVGMPLLIAGGVTMWPKTFDPIERWFSRKFPTIHREGVFQIKEFIADLQRRFPDTK